MNVVFRSTRNIKPALFSGNRSFFTSTLKAQAASNHSPDSYSKDVDSSPASDKTVNRLDPEAENVQRPLDPPTGEWSRAGVKTDEYRHVEQGGKGKEPYAPEGGSKGGHAGQDDWKTTKGPETSSSQDGPDQKSSAGRSG